ncbi:MAG: gamma-glutamyl-gamma-aminobutyrate hydrolase family protein [archaeon]
MVDEYEERRDCLDQRWGPLLRSFDCTPVPLLNRIENVEEYISDLELSGVVFTGGNDLASLDDGSNVAPERDAFERNVLDFALDRDLPAFGVCRGAQFINVYFGGSLSVVDEHVACTHEVSITDSPLEMVSETVTTNSYHTYGIEPGDLARDLRVVGRASDGSIEWVEHETSPVSGVMWHPERDSPSTDLDRRIIKRHFGTREQ